MYEIGGGHLILPALMGELVKRKHEVHLVMAAKENKKLSGLIEESKAIVHIAPWGKKAPASDLVPLFYDWISKLNPDIYVISSSAAIGWLTLPWLPKNLPTYTIGHNDEKTFYEPVRHYHAFLSGAVGVSNQICETYISSCNMLAANVTWIPYGVSSADSISESSDCNPLRLIYIGRFDEPQKRIMDLAVIINQLNKRNVNFICELVGDGPEMEAFSEKLKDEVEAGKVVIHGWLDKSKVLTTLKNADVFILTSAFEGFSIALTEAMANGCCPVVTNIKAGNQQLIKDGENGFLIDVGNVEGFVEKISLLSLNRGLLNRMRLQAWQTGKIYSIRRMAEKYEELFVHDLNNGGRKIANTNKEFPVMPSCKSKYPLWLRRIKARFEVTASV